MGSNGDFIKYSIVLLMKNIEEPFVYDVPSEEIERFKGFLSDSHKEEFSNRKFFCFDTNTNKSVAVSVANIQLVHFLWEKALEEKPSEYEDDEPPQISIYLRERAKCYTGSFDEFGEASVFFTMLDGWDLHQEKFYSFIDVDGEQITVKFKEIVLIEFNKALLEDGFEELNSDESEDDELQF